MPAGNVQVPLGDEWEELCISVIRIITKTSAVLDGLFGSV